MVGSGTLIPDPHRGAPAHWVETGRSFLLMDCGAGTLRTMARLGLPWPEISHLLVTHFHTDHVGELAPLLFALKHGRVPPRRDPLTLLGPTGLRQHLAALALAHGPYVLQPGFPLAVHELPPGGEWSHPLGDFKITSVAARHSAESLAVRVETQDGSLGFTGDTGPDPGLATFFRGCEVLLAECSHPDGEEKETHLTPGELAALAKISNPELLVAVHCYPPLNPTNVPNLLAEAGYEGRVLTGWDGLGLDLKDGVAEVLGTKDG